MLAAASIPRADLPPKDREFSWTDVAEMDCDEIKLADDGADATQGSLSSYFGMMPSLSSSSIASSTTSSGTTAEAEPELSQSLGSTSSFDLRTPLKQTQAHNQTFPPPGIFSSLPMSFAGVDAKLATGVVDARAMKPINKQAAPMTTSVNYGKGSDWRGPVGGPTPQTPSGSRPSQAASSNASALNDEVSPTRASSMNRDSQMAVSSPSSLSSPATPASRMHANRPKLSLPLLGPSAFTRPNVPQTPGGSLFMGARDGAATGAPMSPFVPPTPLVSTMYSKEGSSSRAGFFDGSFRGDSGLDSSPSPEMQKRQSLPGAVSTPKQPRLSHTPMQRHGSIGMSPLSSDFASVSMRTDSRSSDLASPEVVRSSSTARSVTARSVDASPSEASSKLYTPPYSPLFLTRSLQDEGSTGPSRLSSTSSGVGAGSSMCSSSKKRAKDVILGSGGAGMARSFSASRIKTSKVKAAPKAFNLAKPTVHGPSASLSQPMSAPAMKVSFSEGLPSTVVPEIRGVDFDSPLLQHPTVLPASVLPPPLPSPSLLSPHAGASKALHAVPMEKSFSAPPKPAQTVSARHLANHTLHPLFAMNYTIRDELGSGGFGFVVSATRNVDSVPVAVKFIFKEKVPAHGWVRDPKHGVIPMEAFVLKVVDHPGVVKFIDLFDDDVYFYLVMELHGTPWKQPSASAEPEPKSMMGGHPGPAAMLRRTSCDLFECIEQHSRLSEEQARWVFAQVVEVVWHLDLAGICHRDIKDENCVVDADFNVKLIDFGSAVITDARQPTPYFNRFFGTMTFASSEILQGKQYRAPHAEIWSLGVLLSILLSGECPFADPTAAIKGRISKPKGAWSTEALNLLLACLEVDPDKRANIEQVRAHPWVRKAWTDRGHL